MERADLREADLSGAHLEGAKTEGTILDGMKLDKAHVTIFDAETRPAQGAMRETSLR
jgi:uncharacterized protein YjbI with pentapeptide repeats